MSELIERLLAVQEHDCRISRFQRELRDIPARKKEIESRLKANQDAIAEAKEALKARQADVKTVEGEIEAHRQKITKLREQQMQLKTNKEFKTMESEIQGVQDQIHGLEDGVLERMERVEAAQADVKRREDELKDEDALVKEETQRLDQRAAEIAGELTGVTKTRNELATGVDPVWLKSYDRIFQNRKDAALVSVENGSCGGCHMRLPPFQYHDARKHNAIVLCGFCGRMLY